MFLLGTFRIIKSKWFSLHFISSDLWLCWIFFWILLILIQKLIHCILELIIKISWLSIFIIFKIVHSNFFYATLTFLLCCFVSFSTFSFFGWSWSSFSSSFWFIRLFLLIWVITTFSFWCRNFSSFNGFSLFLLIYHYIRYDL